MVMQLYAPAETDRNIIVYGCNSSGCYGPGKAQGDWIVVRTQTDAPADSQACLPTATTAAHATAHTSTAQSSAVVEDADGWGSSGAWGSEGGFEAATAALESLTLSAQESVVASNNRRAHAQAAAAAAATQVQEQAAFPHFPRFRITSCPEPWDEGYEEDEDDVEDSAMEHGEAVVEPAGIARGAREREDEELQHARRLWEAYEAREAVEASASASAPAMPTPAHMPEGDDDLHGEDSEEEQQGDAGEGRDGEQKEDEEGDEWREPHAKDSKRASKIHAARALGGGGDRRVGAERRRNGGGSGAGRGSAGSGGGGTKGGGGGDGGDKYEAVPAKYRYSLAFQQRVALLPEQVVRYDWAGSPLWPTAPPRLQGRAGTGGRRGLQVPPCPRCGGARKFELQLMPGLLFGLKPEEYSPTAPVRLPAPAPHAAAGGGGGQGGGGDGEGSSGSPPAPPLILPGGMDWQSVLVYSCEASCGGPGIAHEWCYVIPPDTE